MFCDAVKETTHKPDRPYYIIHLRIDFVPGGGVEFLRPIGERCHFDQRGGDNVELAVFARNVEVMNGVSEVIAIVKDAGAGFELDLKGETMLGPFRARLQAHLHDAFADGRAIAETGLMTNGVIHDQALSADSTG